MASCYYASKLILRVCQAVLALVAFASSAYLQTKGYKDPTVNFMVFVGVSAWLISMFYSVVSCTERMQQLFWGIVELAITAVWVVFWMAAAAAYAADGRCKPSSVSTTEIFSECNGFLASEAFAWMSWLLWIPSLALAVTDWRRGEGIFNNRL